MLRIAFPRLDLSRPFTRLLQDIIDNSPQAFSGTGDPNGSVVGNVGDLFINKNGSLGTSLWVKESGTGNTGWNAVQAGGLTATWGLISGTLSSQTDLQTALNAKEPTISAGTSGQYWRGDKTWQTLDKNAVGLGNVDNTSDLNKPVSTATQTAIDTKKGVLWNVRILTTTATAAAGDLCDCDASGGAFTVTLPNVATNSGQTIIVCKADSSANAVTIAGTINGAVNLDITLQYTSISLASNGTEWRVI